MLSACRSDLYGPWSCAHRFDLSERVEGLGDRALFFVGPNAVRLNVYFYARRTPDAAPTVRFALRRGEAD